jgi:hypothetical protein
MYYICVLIFDQHYLIQGLKSTTSVLKMVGVFSGDSYGSFNGFTILALGIYQHF